MESYKREESSGAIINTNKASLQKYKQVREIRRQKTKKIDLLEDRIDKLENMLQQLLDNK